MAGQALDIDAPQDGYVRLGAPVTPDLRQSSERSSDASDLSIETIASYRDPNELRRQQATAITANDAGANGLGADNEDE